MAKSTFLGIERITNLESAQGLKAINAAISKLERSANAQLRIRDIGNGPVTLTEEDVTTHGVIILSGATDNFTVNVPATLNTNAIERSYIIKNSNPGFIATITSGVGTPTNIPGSGTSYIFQDSQGINPVNDPQASGGGGGGGSGDVIGPASAAADGIALFNGTSGTVLKTSTVTIDAIGNITAANINGRNLTVDGAKLDGIEANATADQTGPEIKTLYEAQPNTNAFSDTYKTKVDGIEQGATADQTDAEIVTAYNNEVPRITVTEITQGTETAVRTVSPKDVKDIVDAHAPSGGGGSGDLSGPATSTTDAVAVYSDGTGNTVKNSTVTIDGSGNIATTGTVDGRDVSVDGAKLDTVETGATADLTGPEIKALYEGQTDTNAFNNAEKTKLAGIEAAATADMTGAEIKTAYEAESDTNAFTNSLKAKLESIDAAHYAAPLNTTVELAALPETGLTDKERRYIEGEQSDYFYDQTAGSGDIAPTDQTGGTGFWKKVSSGGETATSIKTKYESNANTNVFDDAAQTKLDGIATNATADQTGAEIKALYEAEADTNAFTDAKDAKLSGIESNATADQTDAEIKTAYENNADTNAFTDSNAAKLSIIEAGATADQTGSEIKALYEAEADTNAFTDAKDAKLSGIESNATADQTGAEIKTLYEAEADTNAFTDAKDAKLTGIESNATADQTGSEIKTLYEAEADTNAFTDAKDAKLTGIEANATADQSNAEIEAAYNSQVSQVSAGEITAGTETSVRRFSPEDVANIASAHASGGGGSMSDAQVKTAYENNTNTNAYTDADQAKVAGIEAGATADQTGSEIKALYEAEANTNQYSDGEKAKLVAIEANATADQTGAEIKSLYEAEANTNQYSDGEKAKLAAIEANATADQTGAEIKTALFAEADTNNLDNTLLAKLNGIEDGASSETYSTILTKLSGAPITPTAPDTVDKILIQDVSTANSLRIITVQSILDLLSTSLSGTDIESGYNSQVPQVSAAEITAGTETDVRRLSPDNITSFINQHASSNAMTGSQIKTALFAESDTNNLNDALKTKLDNIDENATPTNSANVIAALEEPLLPTEAPASNDGILFRDISDGDSLKLASPVQIAAFANSNLTGTQITSGLDGHNLTGVLVQPTDKILIQDISDSDNIKVTTAQDIADLAAVSVTDAEIETGYNNRVSQVTSGEITTAQETNVRRFSPADIANIATTHAAGASLTDSQVETAYNSQVSQVSAGEITAGTETNIRRYSPADVAALIAAHGGGGGGGGGGGAPDVVITALAGTDTVPGGSSYVVDWAVHGMSVFIRNELGLTSTGGGVGGLTPGTYWVEGRAPFFRVNNALLRLNFNEGGETFVYGTPAYSNANANGYGDQVMAFVEGEFTVTASATLKMDYRTSYSTGTNDKGKPGSWDVGPVARQTMKIWKV